MKNQRRSVNARLAELRQLRASTEQEVAHIASEHFRGYLRSEHPYSEIADSAPSAQVEYFLDSNSDRARELGSQASKLPTVTSQRWHNRSNLQIAIVSDERIFQTLEPTAQFTRINPETEQDLEGQNFDLVVAVWPLHDTYDENIGRSTKLTIDLAVQLGIPVIVYDPSEETSEAFRQFASTVNAACTVVTRSDECSMDHQGMTCSCTPMQLGVNPLQHNPLGSMRQDQLQFHVSDDWLDTDVKIQSAMERILDGLLAARAATTITNHAAQDDKSLTPRYLPSLHPGLSNMQPQLDRLFPAAVVLNRNSGSQSQYSSRVLELQASGTLVATTYNAGVNSEFSHVVMPDSRLDAKSFVLSQTERSLRRNQVEGVRAVFTNLTAFDTLQQLIAAAGLTDDSRPLARRVAVIAKSPEEFEAFKQTQLVEAEIFYLPHDRLAYDTGGECGDIAINIDWENEHSPHLIQDLINGFKFTDVDVVVAVDANKSTNAPAPYEVSDLPGGLQVNAAYWIPPNLTVQRAIETATTSATVAHNFPVTELKARVRSEPKLSVVVPVYNNGRHLRDKCMASLQRSSIFTDMEILLIDDGSTDLETRYILGQLEREHVNVEVFAFEPGGSGSASRPRNKGLALARAPLITYLDPDNEATNDGYAVLGKLVDDNDLNFAIGDIVMFRRHRNSIRNANTLIPWIDHNCNLDERALELTNFQPMSIQALVARTSWLRDLGLLQPVGAVGQDSYFFQQMLYYAKRVRAISLPIHTYYAAVSGSTVNNVSVRFFEKYLPLERARSEWLRSVGLLESYNRRRLERYTKVWYMDKLNLVKPEDHDQAASVLREIIAMFDYSDWQDPGLRDFFG